MKLLLDTHALLWWLSGDKKLPKAVVKFIGTKDTDVYVSAASAWEIATKVRIGKLPEAEWLSGQFMRVVKDQGFSELPVSIRHGDLAGSLPGIHRDPFDRVLAAQSLLEGMAIATNDIDLKSFGVKAFW